MPRPLPLRLARRILCHRIRFGPFQGMRYSDEAQGSALMPKILGTYELELHEAFREYYTREDLSVIDVGAAEGYYAVGMLFRNPQARVTAFETTPHGQTIMQRLARLNHVTDRLTINGECDPPSLQATLTAARPEALVIMDVEGAEDHLLDPAAIPPLARCHIIVEVHGGIEERLEARFRETHAIRRIPSREIAPSDIPSAPWRWLAQRFHKLSRRLLHERSHRMNWLHLTPLPAQAQPG